MCIYIHAVGENTNFQNQEQENQRRGRSLNSVTANDGGNKMKATHRPRWISDSTKIMHLGRDGNVTKEIPTWNRTRVINRENKSDQHTKRKVHEFKIALVCKTGRVAGVLESRDAVEGSDKQDKWIFSYFGENGAERWAVENVYSPQFSDDGDYIGLVKFDTGNEKRTALIKNEAGKTLFEFGPLGDLGGLSITPNGKYGVVHAGQIERDQEASTCHVFFEVETGETLVFDVVKYLQEYGHSVSAEIDGTGKAIIYWFDHDSIGNETKRHEKLLHQF
jgi:hypothetical protein